MFPFCALQPQFLLQELPKRFIGEEPNQWVDDPLHLDFQAVGEDKMKIQSPKENPPSLLFNSDFAKKPLENLFFFFRSHAWITCFLSKLAHKYNQWAIYLKPK